MPHQQSCEGEQSRSELPRRHTRWQRRAGRGSAARAGEPMPLIFGNDRFDRRQFPDLMPQRFSIRSRQPCPTTSAVIRMQDDDFRAAFDGHEFAHLPWMSLLSAAFLLRLRFRPGRRSGMRMHSRRRHRGILRRELFHLSFQFIKLGLHPGHTHQQRFDIHPHRRRHLSQ
jgi:hypothetical protein